MKASSLNETCGGPDWEEGRAEGPGIQTPRPAGQTPARAAPPPGMGRGGGGGSGVLEGGPGAPAGRWAGQQGGEKDAEEEPDEALIARMRDGDSGALAKLWARYTGLLYTQAHAILHNPVDSEEVVAEMFVEVWQRAGNYHPERARPVAWLVTLVRRRAIDRLRERRSHERAGARLSEESAHSGPWADGGNGHSGEGVVDQMRLAELRGLLESVMGQLPESQRETVRMVYFMGLTQKEISLRTRTPLGTVKTRLELGLRKMRDRIRGSRVRALARGTEEL